MTDFARHGAAMLARADAVPDQRFGNFYLSRLLGFEVSHGEGSCTVSFAVVPTLYNPQGTLHGGILASAMDISMGHLLHRAAGAGATLEIKVQYLSSVKDGIVTCEGTFLRQGRKTSFLQSHARRQDGELIAHATATWRLLPRAAGSGA